MYILTYLYIRCKTNTYKMLYKVYKNNQKTIHFNIIRKKKLDTVPNTTEKNFLKAVQLMRDRLYLHIT